MRAGLATACFVWAGWAAPAVAHPVWATFAEAHYRAERGVLEIALKVTIHDLEHALSKRTGKPVKYDDAGGTDAAIHAWVDEVFVVEHGKAERLRSKWVGQEAKVHDAWLYFEVAVPKGAERVRITQRAFFDLNAKQVNTVTVQGWGGARERVSKILTREAPTLAL